MKEIENCLGRLAKLRLAMQASDIQACIIPSSDAHQSEYTAAHWKTRTYFSGFTGSAGTLVVTTNQAALWTDSRYYLQAEKEIAPNHILLQKDGMPDTPSIEQWIRTQLSNVPQAQVGIDGSVFSIKEVQQYQAFFGKNKIALDSHFNPLAQVWTSRPAIPLNPLFLQDEAFCGEKASDKIHRLRQVLSKEACDSLLITALDDIAWIFNVRGNDVSCNPVAVAYAFVGPKESVLFVDPRKVSLELKEALQEQGIWVADYDRLPTYLATYPALSLRVDRAKANYLIFQEIEQLAQANPRFNYTLAEGPSPIAMLKAVKNSTEISGVKKAMEKDGVVMVQLLMWIEESLETQQPITEMDVEAKLQALRAKQTYYVGESFDAIVGFQGNGAIVHYHASPQTNQVIQKNGMLLIDTGGQYFDGTTDITRTLLVGTPTEQMKKDFTLVLKGHIAIDAVIFPAGTRGAQLDVLARRHLWKEGLAYFHGTGHGVGHFLNVHEGPQNIRLEENSTPIVPGMITSNEPGLYRAEAYGIRIENLILCKEHSHTEFGDFYAFEALTLCPIDLNLVDRSLLTTEETQWLNQYHQEVYSRLSPWLSTKEQAWLQQKTKTI